MEPLGSSAGLTATGRVFVALPIALFLTVYLLGGLAIQSQFHVREACHPDARPEFVVPRD
jgi:hypothetical protein